MTSRDKSVASRECLTLAERVEAATGPDRVLDADIAVAVGAAPALAKHEGNCSGWLKAPDISYGVWKSPEYTASLDSALALVPEGYEFGVGTEGGKGCAFLNRGSEFGHDYFAATPALALCAAALRARAGVTQ